MKPLERDSLILQAMGERGLVEHMLRLWMSRMKDERTKEQKAEKPWVRFLHEAFAFDVATGQVAYVYERQFDLAGFATWWQLSPSGERSFAQAAKDGINLGDANPPDMRTVTQANPSAVYVRSLVTKPNRPSVVNVLARSVTDSCQGTPRFFWWDRRERAIREWSGNNEPRDAK